MTLPQPSGGFEWVQESWGPALRCAPLSAVALHCFSTRKLELGAPEETAGWTALARALDADLKSIVRMAQVHGTAVFEPPAGRPPARRVDDWPQADIAITADPFLVLTVRGADCVPILIADPRTGGVAAVHAGWKGAAAGAALAAVQALAWRFGSEPDDLIAAVGPGIGPCCYVVGDEIVGRFAAHPDASRWFTRPEGDQTLHLDLWRATHDQLARAGVSPENIHACDLCTSHHPDLFHSYRRDGQSAGRLVGAIRSGRGTTP
jgi:polyphenol oxidase